VADSDIEQLVRIRPLDLQRRPPALKHCGCCEKPFSDRLRPTRDHIIPQGFISRPPPPNLPTWRVCHPCQQLLSPAEDRLRNVMASAFSRHPEQARADVAARASRATRPVIPDRVEFRTTDAGLAVAAGIVASNGPDVELVFGKIARGLFYWRHAVTQPADTPIAVSVPSAAVFSNLTDYLLKECGMPVQRLGWDIWWVTQSEPPRDGVWLFIVFGAVPVYVATGAGADKGAVVPRPHPIAVKLDTADYLLPSARPPTERMRPRVRRGVMFALVLVVLGTIGYIALSAPETGIAFTIVEMDGGTRDGGQWWPDGGWL